MHLAQRAYLLVAITGVLAIAGTWSEDPVFAGVWRVPAALLLGGLALEGWLMARTPVAAAIETAPRAHLGRGQAAAFAFGNSGARDLLLEYAPVTPPGIAPLDRPRTVRAPRGGVGRDPFTLLPVRLGAQPWPAVPLRVLGRFGLAWWSRQLAPPERIVVGPDTLGARTRRPPGHHLGLRPRRLAGAGAELHQLRAYVPGDPLARIDWKATARVRRLVSREFSEDQHLDILVAIDAGRLSRVRAGAIDRFGLYANVAARFAEIAVPNDDRVGLVVFAGRTLAVCPPARGLGAVTRIRRTLEQLGTEPSESDPIGAAMRIRTLLRHRSLIVLLTGLEDAALAEQLARTVRLLSPPHLVVVAGVHGTEIERMAHAPAQSWRDPWIALAAQEHAAAARAQRALLARLGAPVIAAREDALERAVFAEYERLRRRRRV